MKFIAQRLKYFDSSDFREVFDQKTKLPHPIDLSVGEPEESTTDYIKEAGIHAIRENKTKYTPANGIPELRAAIAKKLREENSLATASEENVTVVPGLTTGQLLIYMAILDPGDEILVMDPYYPPYNYLASSIGARVTLIPVLPDFQPNLLLIEAAITSRTKAIVINSPNNPTGAVYSEVTLHKIAQIAEKHNLLVISDEIYEHFVYEGKHFSIGSIYPNTLTLNGFSKEFAMTGWRIGYIAGPQEIINAINELQQYMVFASSSIAQYAALAALTKRPDTNGRYAKKRDLVKESLKKMGYDIHGMHGAFYSFFKAPGDLTDTDFVEKLAEHNLILVPGRAFSQLRGFVRLSYGAPQDLLTEGLRVLSEVTAELRKKD